MSLGFTCYPFPGHLHIMLRRGTIFQVLDKSDSSKDDDDDGDARGSCSGTLSSPTVRVRLPKGFDTVFVGIVYVAELARVCAPVPGYRFSRRAIDAARAKGGRRRRSARRGAVGGGPLLEVSHPCIRPEPSTMSGRCFYYRPSAVRRRRGLAIHYRGGHRAKWRC